MSRYATYKGVTYANGYLPDRFKKPLDGNNYALPSDPAVLREDAADSWNRARADVLRQTGLVLTVRGWNRSIADQERFFFERYEKGKYSPYGDYRSYKGATYGRVRGAAAAIPGTSNHGLGTTVDVVDFGSVGEFDNARRQASIAILRRHGWDDTEGRSVSEPWHLVYVPSQDTHPKPPRTYHRRYATQPLAVREVPGGEVLRILSTGQALSVVDGSGKKVGENWYAQTTTGNWVRSSHTSRNRPFHVRETTRETHVYTAPGTGEGRLLPVGKVFTVWDGSGRKRGTTWWVQTTAGNWVRSASTRVRD